MALRVGAFGLGRMGRRHLLALVASPRWRVVLATLGHRAALRARGQAFPEALLDG